MSLRDLSSDERRLLDALLSASGLPSRDSGSIQVQPLDDSGMGSLRLVPQIVHAQDRAFGRAVSESRFNDADGVEVIATLYLDSEDQPFELDVWKTNFAPLIKIPEDVAAYRAE